MKQRLDLFIGDDRVDQFKDETVSIKQLVKDIKDPKKLFTSFTKRFNLPASRNNNKIFKHYHKNEIDNTIDARTYLDASMKLGGYEYKVGNVELNSVRVENDSPVGYQVTFYGNTTELAKKLQNDELKDLDLSGQDHSNAENDVYNKFNTNTGNLNIKYPLMSIEKRFAWHPGNAAYAVGTDNLANLAYVDATRRAGSYGVDKDDLRPALRLQPILTAIATKYGLTYAADSAFNQDYIKDLHLLLYRKQIDSTATITTIEQQLTSATPPSIGALNEAEVYNDRIEFGLTGFQYTYTHELDLSVSPSDGSTYTVNIYEDDVIWSTSGATSGVYVDSFSGIFQSGSTYTIKIDGDIGTSFTLTNSLEEIEVANPGNSTTHNYTDSLTLSDTSGQFVISENIPNIKILDFLSGLFKMFNLVATVDKDLVLDVKTYTHFMSQYSIKDITKFVDTSSYTVSKTNEFSRIDLRFKQPKLRLTKKFSEFVGREYGSSEWSPSANSQRLTGGAYDITIPFQMPVSETPPNLDFPTSGSENAPVNYLQMVNESGKETDIAPYLFYCFPVGTGVGSLSAREICYDRSSGVTQVDKCFLISNIYRTYDTILSDWHYIMNNSFNDEIAVWDSIDVIDRNLFNYWYKDFIAQSFDIKTRKYEYKAKLSEGFLLNLNLYDVLTVNDRKFKINSIKTNHNTSISDLELITITDPDLFNITEQLVQFDATTDSKIGYIDQNGNPKILHIGAGLQDADIMIGSPRFIEGTVTLTNVAAGRVWNFATQEWEDDDGIFNS